MSRALMPYSTMICRKTMNIIFTVSAEPDVPEKKALPITSSVAENRNRKLRAISQYTRANIEELNLPTSAEMKQEALDQLQQRLQEQCSSAAPSEEAVQLAEQLIAAGTPAETLLALLLQEEITAATKNLPAFDIPKPIRKGKRSGAATVSCTSMLAVKNAWLQTLSWGHWWKQRNFPARNSERLTSTTNSQLLKYRLRKHLTLLLRCSPRKSMGIAVKVKLFEETQQLPFRRRTLRKWSL